MPGPVVESHADVESECGSCHAPFNRGRQRDLCSACHEDIAGDIAQSTGFHGGNSDARNNACSDCHTEHEGRDAKIVVLDRNTFDHAFTDFPLLGGHLEAACEDCHAPGSKQRDAPRDCIACHRDDDTHKGFMGEQCSDCHTTVDWRNIDFDHDTTGFPLLGGHREAACSDCHTDSTFRDTPATCFGCHATDDVHNGRSGQQCNDCHNPVSWKDTSFDHGRDTSFALDGRHGELACGDCHSSDPFADKLDTACLTCHRDDDKHRGHFGTQCASCHATTRWSAIRFDHARDTMYALHGAHTTIACEACHIEPVFEVALASGCSDCHAKEDPHEGQLGIACQDCHNDSSWKSDVFFDHDLTRFPLLGKHVDAACDACHQTHAFRDAPDACVDCHTADDPHADRYGDDCAACHNPVNWRAWQFDHDRQTDFALTGAHADTACNACHRQPLTVMGRTSMRCGDCHRADDIHDGKFGADCARCHTADNFHDVRSIQ